MITGETENEMICRALLEFALTLRKDSRSRKWAGPHHAITRKTLRARADRYEALAEKMRVSAEDGGGR